MNQAGRRKKSSMDAGSPFAQTAGIVLVGTHPWTNSPFDSLLPRALLPVAHRPLIAYALSWLQQAGIEHVAVCANRETRTLQSRLAHHLPQGMTLSYHEDPMPRGAAGSLSDAASACDAGTFVVAEGTAVPNVNLRELLVAHHASGAGLTVVVHAEPGRNGNPCLQVPSGIYVLGRRVLAAVPSRGFCDIKEHLIPQLYRSGERVAAYAASGPTPRVLSSATYLAVNEWMVDHLVASGEPLDGYVRSGDCLLHSDALIAADAILVGPVLVGPGARVMAGAVIVGPTSIGLEVTVEPGALVSRSAIWRRSLVGEQSMTDRCIVTDDSVVDPRTSALGVVIIPSGRREGKTTAGGRKRPERRDTSSFTFRRTIGRFLSTHRSRSPVTS
jgi:mannose-1-phosphate guanylyltransferase